MSPAAKVPIVFVLVSGLVTVDDYYGTVAVDPIDVAALDVIRPGIVTWVSTARACDAVEVRVNREEWALFYATRVDDRFRRRVADQRVVANGADRETLTVMYVFEKSEWRRRGCDIDGAVAYLADGWRVADVPYRPADTVDEPFAVIVVRWLPPGVNAELPILYPVDFDAGDVSSDY